MPATRSGRASGDHGEQGAGSRPVQPFVTEDRAGTPQAQAGGTVQTSDTKNPASHGLPVAPQMRTDNNATGKGQRQSSEAQQPEQKNNLSEDKVHGKPIGTMQVEMQPAGTMPIPNAQQPALSGAPMMPSVGGSRISVITADSPNVYSGQQTLTQGELHKQHQMDAQGLKNVAGVTSDRWNAVNKMEVEKRYVLT